MTKHPYMICLCIFFVTVMFTSDTLAGREIPDDNLSYPVLIRLEGSGTASGFYASDWKSLYFVTASHVLFSDQGVTLRTLRAELLSYPANPKDIRKVIISLDLALLQTQSQIRVHKTHDVTIVRMAALNEKKEINFVQGVQFKQETEERNIVSVDITSSVKKFEDVFEANEVYIFGYPTSLGIEQIKQIDYERPLLRKGIIAGRNPQNRTLIVDCPVYFGNSGGPVVEVEHKGIGGTDFLVVGVVSQFVPFKEEFVNKPYGFTNIQISNSGYAIVTPMDAVLELLWK